MSLEAIRKITDTEQSYKQKKDEALAAAQRLVVDAERGGKIRLEKAKAQAESEARILLKEAEEKAAIHARDLMNESEIRCESLRKTAEERLEKVVDIIVERIVSV